MSNLGACFVTILAHCQCYQVAFHVSVDRSIEQAVASQTPVR